MNGTDLVGILSLQLFITKKMTGYSTQPMQNSQALRTKYFRGYFSDNAEPTLRALTCEGRDTGSLEPRLTFGGRGKRAWYTLSAHAQSLRRNF